MTPNEINTAIAEFCGWVPHYNGHWYRLRKPNADPIEWTDNTGVRQRPPDYYNDLNLIREAVLNLTSWMFTDQDGQKWSQRCEFMFRLEHIVDRDDPKATNFEFYNATAPQRCEAMLGTIGKWREA